MKNIIIPFFLLIALTSCSSAYSSENVTPVWGEGVFTAEYENEKYRAAVSFAENEMMMCFSEPAFLKDITVHFDGDAFKVSYDGLLLSYDNTVNCVFKDFYNCVRTAKNNQTVYIVQDDTLISEFESNGKLCRIILDKRNKKVISLEMPEGAYKNSEEVASVTSFVVFEYIVISAKTPRFND